MIGLRSLNVLFTLIEENLENIVKDIVRLLQEEDVNKEKNIENRAEEFILKLTELLTCLFIKKTSNAVGSHKLKRTYDEILKEFDTTAVSLIDLSLSLDHFNFFPDKKVFNLSDKLKKNFFSSTILKYLVVDYFYMFPATYKLRQKVCDKLGISFTQFRLIDYKRKTKSK